MSSEYIYEYAKNFEDLYSRMAERLEMLQAHSARSEDFDSIRPLLSQMEGVLNNLELEASLISRDKTSSSAEHNILQSCRSHFNDVRKRFHKMESELPFQASKRKDRTEKTSLPQSSAVSDIESLRSKYCENIPFDEIPIARDLRTVKTREEFKKRLIYAASALLTLLLLIKLIK